MTTPRAEAIKKSGENVTIIRDYDSENPLENRIDHYAVLSQVINEGVRIFLSDEQLLSRTAQATSLPGLDAALRNSIYDATMSALKTAAFAAHAQALRESQEARAKDGSRDRDIGIHILSGAGTFIQTFSLLFHFLESRLGIEVASHKENWRLADRIAKLPMHAFMAYQETYLRHTRHHNWDELMAQLESGPQGGVRFRSGFPRNALVPESLTRPVTDSEPDDAGFSLDGTVPLIPLHGVVDFETAIGCPVTFTQNNLRGLWSVYAMEAHRIKLTPAILPSDDTEACVR